MLKIQRSQSHVLENPASIDKHIGVIIYNLTFRGLDLQIPPAFLVPDGFRYLVLELYKLLNI